MQEAILIFKSELKKMVILKKRYILSFITDIVVYYILFMGLYFFIVNNMGKMPKEEIDKIVSMQIVGYMSWFFFSFTISFMSNGIYNELVEGTFEQLCLTYNSITKIYFIKLLVYSLINTLIIFPLGLLLVLSTGVSLMINKDLVIVFLIMLIGTIGFSYLLGGITIRYKRTGQLAFIISIFFLGTSIIDFSNIPEGLRNVFYALPFTKGTDLMKSTIINGNCVVLKDIVFLSINSLVYLIIGIIIFRLAFSKATSEGTTSRF
ncbi:ABC transporter permease [Caloranaerobacter azorensis]|nr:ABC transporter permease [Caloranaerobacter azorensis]